MKIPQGEAKRGSQKWLQHVINGNSAIFSRAVLGRCPELDGAKLEWLSPLQKDDYAEYQDGDFLKLLGLARHASKLHEFWPSRGPVWDGLGRTDDGSGYFLIEAKANVPEIISDCGAKSPRSVEMIETAIRRTQKWLKAESRIDWTKGFYQFANRLAHLYFLNEVAGERAYLINLYFVHDTTHLPTEIEAWEAALTLQKRLMGLDAEQLRGRVIDFPLHISKVKT
jgi:hypothetical protein